MNDAKAVSGTRHIVKHLKVAYRINSYTGLLLETLLRLRFSTPFEAAKVARLGLSISQSLWQEDALQSALVD